jgi:2-polyprenyl-6-methoxyphenol hydroxylase-like FAD-dependent oxidoreductase
MMQVLIAGGGVAGPVTAMALQKVGIEATVFEAYPETDPELGSYFTITANGLTALGAIDAFELVETIGFSHRCNVLWNHAGRRLATIPLDSSLSDSPPAHTMKRSRLARTLQDEAIRRGIPIHFGHRLTDAEITDRGGVVARCDGGTTHHGDLLVGADGVHSVVRRAIDPEAPSGRYVGLTNFGGITTGAADEIEPGAWHMIFGRRGFFGYSATPDGNAIWFANWPRPMIQHDERAATSGHEWKAQLVELFKDDAGLAVELIQAGTLELAADNTHDLGHVPIWHRGPLVVIGDAAHAPAPTSGQGASMAIEDGVVLAGSLRDHETIEAALADYERLRRERVEKVVAFGARGSSNKTPGLLGRFVRDLALPLFFRFAVTEKSLKWMYDYRVDLSAASVTSRR